MNGLDWHAAFTWLLVGIAICQAGALHTAWAKRDYWFNRAEERRVDWLEEVGKRRKAETALADARAVSNVVPLFSGSSDEPLDDRPGVETYDPGSAS